MIVFSPIRTRRITANLKELTAQDASYLCKLRPDMNEAGTTEALRRIVSEDVMPGVGKVSDVRLWTVQERALALSHYIAHTNDGDPNFPIGPGKYSDYLLQENDFPADSIGVGVVDGDSWNIRPLLGLHSESIERLVVTGRLEAKRAGWWVGAMSAMLFRDGEDFEHADMQDSQLDELLESRAKVFMELPESTFMQILVLFLDGIRRVDHLFRLEFLDDGIAFSAIDKEAGLPPARFPFDTAISEAAKAVFGNH